MKLPEHPIQPVVLDDKGVARFKANKLVRYLLDLCTAKGVADMNTLALLEYPREDYEQFAQLIGYSVCGFGELSYASDEVYAIAFTEFEKLKKS